VGKVIGVAKRFDRLRRAPRDSLSSLELKDARFRAATLRHHEHRSIQVFDRQSSNEGNWPGVTSQE
jgi:hypothetical protein